MLERTFSKDRQSPTDGHFIGRTARGHHRALSVTMMAATILASITSQARTGEAYTHYGLQYGFDHFRQSMELYIPNESCGPTPLAIYIHGGGWLTGNAEQGSQYVDNLVKRGFAVASFNYRFSQHQIYPAQIQDCKGAVRYLRANAARYNLDVENFGVFGDSSGGHLAALLGSTGGVASLEGQVGGNIALSSRVQAAVDIYGPTDLFACADDGFLLGEISQLVGHSVTDIIANQGNPAYATLVARVNSANPALFCTVDDPPFHIAHGLNDTVVPSSQSQIMHDALVAAGVPSVLRLLPGLGHSLPDEEYDLAFDFFESLLLTPPQPADMNCDGAVNVEDLLIVINAWGICPNGQPTCPGDVNADGTVNVDDLLAVINSWGK